MFSYFNQPNILQILAYTTLYIYIFEKYLQRHIMYVSNPK